MIHSNNEAGRSMIEMLGVLAIIGVLSVGGIAGYSKAMTKFKINKTVDQISQVVGNIRTLYGTQKTFSGLDSSTEGGKKIIQKGHLVPDEMWNTGRTAIENAFGGTFKIVSTAKKTSGDNKAFSIYIDGIPEEACMELATYDWGSGSSSGLIAIAVPGQSTGSGNTWLGCQGTTKSSHGATVACPNGSTLSVPMPVSEAANACDCADNCNLDFKFY